MLEFLGKEQAKRKKKEIGIAGFTTSIMRHQQEFSGTACMVLINGRNAGPACACGNTPGACHGRFGRSAIIENSIARFATITWTKVLNVSGDL
jgi:hypothetical protein